MRSINGEIFPKKSLRFFNTKDLVALTSQSKRARLSLALSKLFVLIFVLTRYVSRSVSATFLVEFFASSRIFGLKTAAQTTEVVDSECSEQVHCGWSAEADA